MRKARMLWFVSSAFSMVAVFLAYLSAVILSNMGVIELSKEGLTSVEMHSTLAAFSNIWGIALAIGLLVLFFSLAASFGVAAGRS